MQLQFGKLRVDLENVMQSSQVKIGQMGLEVQRTVNNVTNKLAKIKDAEEIREWVEGKIDRVSALVQDQLLSA